MDRKDRRILIGWQNRLDEASLSGGSWRPSLPLANLKSRQISKVARTTDASPGSTTMTLDFGRPRPLRLVCLVGHNASLTARARIRIGDAADWQAGTTYYDETVEVWQGMLTGPWDLDALEWEDDNFWLGGFDPEEIAGLTAVSTHVLPAPRSGRYLRIDILDEGNPAKFFQIGRIFAGPAISPSYGIAWGSAEGWEFTTASEAALGGAEYFDPREGLRVFRFTLQHLNTDEAYGQFLEMVRRQGVHREVFVIPNPGDPYNGLRRNFLGRIRQPGLLEKTRWFNDGSSHSLALEVKELR